MQERAGKPQAGSDHWIARGPRR